jgi:hypothetical protein
MLPKFFKPWPSFYTLLAGASEWELVCLFDVHRADDDMRLRCFGR